MVKEKPTFSELIGAIAFLGVIALLSFIAIAAMMTTGLLDNTVLTFVLGALVAITSNGNSFFLRGKRSDPDTSALAPPLGTNGHDAAAPGTIQPVVEVPGTEDD